MKRFSYNMISNDLVTSCYFILLQIAIYTGHSVNMGENDHVAKQS